ncbi:MAG: exo-alpha-sialidase [Verrucomicrobiaceae bacterium]|nr:exo-alpha-sialidase [Verrucomicrobiaceae bacterium]
MTIHRLFLLLLSCAASFAVVKVEGAEMERTWQGIPGLERTANGRVFSSWFTGGPKEPSPDNTVLLCYSDDQAKTFTSPQAMGLPKDGTRCFDPTLWIDPKGRLWYIFNRGNKDTAVHDVHARICDDPDATPPVFGDEFRVGFDEAPFAFRMNKPTVLSTGEWIMPVTHAVKPAHDWFPFSDQLQGVGISHDEGKTWKLHGALNTPKWALECMIVELKDGRLWLLTRTGSGFLWESHSSDKGETWDEPKASTIANPGSRFFIRRLTSGNLLLVNHYKFKGRSHLTAQISTDDGQTWNEGLLLDERSSISYPDGIQDKDGLLWITYDRDRQGAGEILLAKFKEEDVIAGKNVSGAVILKQIISKLDKPKLLPAEWDPALAGDIVMQRLVNTSAPRVKGAHDAEFVCVGDRAYIVTEANDVKAGESAGWPFIYATLSIVNLKTLALEQVIDFAKGEQVFENETLPVGACFVPRILQKDDGTLRCYFTSEDPGKRQSQMWYRDFDLKSGEFVKTIHKAKLKTAAGTFDFQPQYFHADAAAQGFTKKAVDSAFFIFDSFKKFDGKLYVALNNFSGKQNALALVHDDLETFEVLGHFNEPQSEQLSEPAVNRLPDGTWMAIIRNDKGNYHFSTSADGKTWSVGKQMPQVPNGANSKPTFDKFGGVYYLGWQEATKIQGVNRSVFNVDISRDGKTWERKYRFETPKSFQYPTFHEHNGTIWLAVTQGDKDASRKERIMFGKLEDVGKFESQAGQKRIEWPAPPPDAPVVMKRGVKLFTDREYVIDEMPDAVKDLPFLRTSIEKMDVTVSKAGTLFALTPTIRPKAASQEEALQKAGFAKVDVPETQLFPGEINRVSLYRKAVKAGERLQFRKMVLLVLADGARVGVRDPNAPVVIANPGAEFQDDARPGAMIIGMDRTPKGRIWGCWTGTGDKKDGYFLLATSDDDGASWSKPRLAVGARTEFGQKLSGALVGNLWTDPKGRLWLFFDQQLGNPDDRVTNWFMRCDDPDSAEPTWSEPVPFADGCTLNKPTVLKNGDWLLPVSDWRKQTARVFASTDEGASWKERGSLQFPGWQFDEHMMVELNDGRLWMLARTKGQPHESFSSDGGATWSEPRQAATVQNVSARFFLRRLKSGRILLVKNGSPTERLQKRTHMAAYLSDDEGQTWKGGLLLDERNAVSYPDGFESPDGLIYILYDWNRHSDAEILMAKFREEDVLAGKIVSKDAKLRMLVNKATGPKPEKLYNGIELPDVWPPRFRDPNSAEPMEVPYLKRPPKTIPIDVGRQLFVDDFLIEKTTLKRTFHQAKKFEGNPVFKAETERELGPSTQGEAGEEATTFTGQGGVFYDPAEKLFKMFYVAGWRGPLSLATSPDMKTWTRHGELLPEGLRWTGTKLNTGGSDNCVWFDLNAKSPAERIKYLTCWLHVPKEQRPEGFMHSLHVSDGKTWSDAVTTSIAADDYCSFFYNPFREKWCFSIKRGTSRGRSRYYYESDEFLKGADWGKGVYWTSTDKLDAPEPQGRYPGAGDTPQLYSLNAVAYESLIVGMHYIHRGPNNSICEKGKFPKLVDLELGFSRDGFHWDRPDRSGFIVGSRTEGSWDRGYLHGAAGVFVVLDDQLVFPYMGTSGIAPSGHRGMYTGGSIGLATLRRDGFASMDGPGELTTRPVKFKGDHLFANVNGEVRVELLDEAGKVIAASAPLAGDFTKQQIELPELFQHAGQPVRFRFHLTRGSLYSFWVTPDEGGSSNGFVGAGGPDFKGLRDTAN